MKSLLSNSIKFSLLSVLAYNARDFKLRYNINFRFFPSQSRYAEAEESDLFKKMLDSEMTADLSKFRHDDKVRYDFNLKTRDEHLKEI